MSRVGYIEMEQTTIIIPAYNEENYIGETLETLLKIPYAQQIIVIDDGSTDQTFHIAKKYDVEVYDNKRNLGKGRSLEKAKRYIKNQYIVMIDADLKSSAKEIDKLIKPIHENKCDVAIAKFPKTKGGGLGLVQFTAKTLIYYLTKKTIECPLSGQRAMRKEIFQSIHFGEKYSAEVIMTIELFLRGYKVLEIPVEMYHRELGKGAKGFCHRGRQFIDILIGFLNYIQRWKN